MTHTTGRYAAATRRCGWRGGVESPWVQAESTLPTGRLELSQVVRRAELRVGPTGANTLGGHTPARPCAVGPLIGGAYGQQTRGLARRSRCRGTVRAACLGGHGGAGGGAEWGMVMVAAGGTGRGWGRVGAGVSTERGRRSVGVAVAALEPRHAATGLRLGDLVVQLAGARAARQVGHDRSAERGIRRAAGVEIAQDHDPLAALDEVVRRPPTFSLAPSLSLTHSPHSFTHIVYLSSVHPCLPPCLPPFLHLRKRALSPPAPIGQAEDLIRQALTARPPGTALLPVSIDWVPGDPGDAA
jgi:hypothetical protein